MTLPTMTEEQRKLALEKARIARVKRSEFRSDIAAGKYKSAADAIAAAKADDVLAKTKVLAFVKSFPGIGGVSAAKIMQEAKIPDNRRIGGLGVKQVETLSNLIDK